MDSLSARPSLRPFWAYVFLFKFGAGLHYTLLAALGARILPIWQVGLLIGGGAFVQLLLDVPAGHLLDRWGYVRLLRLGTVAFALAGVVLLPGLTPASFLATLVLATAGWLFFGPGTNAYMLATVSRASAGRELGFYHAVSSGGIVASTFALAAVVNLSTPAIALCLSAVLIAASVAAYLMPPEPASVHAERKVARHTYYVRRHLVTELLRKLRELDPASTLLIIQNVVAGIFYASIWFAVPVMLEQSGKGGLWGAGLSVFDLAVVVLGSLFGRLADRADRRRLVFCGLLLFAVAGMLIGFNFSIWFLVLGFLATAGDELSSVSLWAWLDQLDKDHEGDGVINGAIVLASDLGWSVGPALAGLMYAQFGPTWTIVGAAVPLLIAWFVATVSFWRLPRFARAVPAPLQPRHKS